MEVRKAQNFKRLQVWNVYDGVKPVLWCVFDPNERKMYIYDAEETTDIEIELPIIPIPQPRYYYKEFERDSDTLKLHYTQAPFIGWTRGGLLNAWYAMFQRKSEIMLVPYYHLTKDTKALLPTVPQEETVQV